MDPARRIANVLMCCWITLMPASAASEASIVLIHLADINSIQFSLVYSVAD